MRSTPNGLPHPHRLRCPCFLPRTRQPNDVGAVVPVAASIFFPMLLTLGLSVVGISAVHAAPPPANLRSSAPSNAVAAASNPAPRFADLTTSTLLDKIRGAWAGKCMGVIAGTPVEFRSCGKIYNGPLGWDLPTTVALYQDDLYVNMVFLRTVEQKGLDATQREFADAFRDSGFALFHANLAARRNLLMGIPAPLSGRPPHNLHADDIDFQIESDFIGLISPGLPRAASNLAFRIGPIMNYGDGVYGGVFVANLYAQAFVESDMETIVDNALRAIPPDSEYRRCVESVVDQHRRDPSDWKAAWSVVEVKWDGDDRCPGGIGTPFNIDAKINGAYVAIALLYGDKDPHRTVDIATRCGQDADCNPSTAMGVLGAVLGYDALPREWQARVETLGNERFSYVPYTFDGVCRATLRLALATARKDGAAIHGGRLHIALQSPAPPATTQQWDDGLVAVAGKPFTLPDWNWKGRWRKARARGMICFATNQPGDSGEIQFQGEGVELIGCLADSGGRLALKLDDRPTTTVETYEFTRGPMPLVYPNEGLWFSGPIPAGPHRLKITLLKDANPHSNGHVAGIQGIYIFRSRKNLPSSTTPPPSRTAGGR